MKYATWLVLVTGFALFMNETNYGKTIEFSGLTWKIRGDGQGSPARNFWRQDNVWVDEKGQLHLKIRKVGDVWTCAELQTAESFLYGKFSFEIIGRIDELDKNIVLGLFKYPQENARDGFDEIDIEFSKWGKTNNNIGNFTVYANNKSFVEKTHNFSFNLGGSSTTHAFTRTPKDVYFQSFHGFNTQNKIYEWSYSSDNISKIPMPIYLNFWLYQGLPPSNLEEIEIVVKNVKVEN
jgi:Glycosyl hydrolases family 16